MKTLIIIGILLWPSLLGSGELLFFVEKWPQVIMDTGTYAYVMEEPGGEIFCLNIKPLGREDDNEKTFTTTRRRPA